MAAIERCAIPAPAPWASARQAAGAAGDCQRPETFGSSVRYYYEAARLRPRLDADDFVLPPTAIAMWPKDIAMAPRDLAARLYNVQRYTVVPRGGHFPAWEQPNLYAEDLCAIARWLQA